MAWNEPGGNKDPWSRKPKGNSEVDKIMKEKDFDLTYLRKKFESKEATDEV